MFKTVNNFGNTTSKKSQVGRKQQEIHSEPWITAS